MYRAQKSMLNTSEESREIDMVKKTGVMMTKANNQDTKIGPKRNAGNVVQCMSLAHVWHLGKLHKM